MKSTHCEACGLQIDGRRIEYLFYLENAETSLRKYVFAVQCQNCDAVYCAAGSNQDHPRMSWWNGWEKVCCPRCRKLIGPGAMIVAPDAPEIVDPVLEPFLITLKDESETIKVRAEAAVELGYLGGAQAVEPLVAALGDSSKQLRQAAGYALFDIGAPAVDLLVASLHHGSITSRRAATEVLGQIGDRRALEPLLALLEGDDQSLHIAAAIALEKIGDRHHLNL